MKNMVVSIYSGFIYRSRCAGRVILKETDDLDQKVAKLETFIKERNIDGPELRAKKENGTQISAHSVDRFLKDAGLMYC